MREFYSWDHKVERWRDRRAKKINSKQWKQQTSSSNSERGIKWANSERQRREDTWICGCVQTWFLQPRDRLCSHYRKQWKVGERWRGVGSPETCLLTWFCHAESHSAQPSRVHRKGMLPSLIRSLCVLPSRKTQSRLSLSVDLPEGYDSAEFTV